MDPVSVILLIKLVSEGIGVASSIANLAKRVEAGEEITIAEVDAIRAERLNAVAEWDAATGVKPATP